MAAPLSGIWGLSAAEAIYPAYYVDADGDKLEGSHRYTLRFAPCCFPPVNAFWSLTMYELPESLMVKNPINRYLLNSTMLDDLCGTMTAGSHSTCSTNRRAKNWEPNWLPAPKGPFSSVMRLYLPKPEALDGTWKLPKLKKAD
jgi:hypothetical protein